MCTGLLSCDWLKEVEMFEISEYHPHTTVLRKKLKWSSLKIFHSPWGMSLQPGTCHLKSIVLSGKKFFKFDLFIVDRL